MRSYALFMLVVVLGAVCLARASDKCDASKGEVFRSCGTACPDTCDNHLASRPCTMQCVPGCFCKPGTVRRESDGYCVRAEEC